MRKALIAVSLTLLALLDAHAAMAQSSWNTGRKQFRNATFSSITVELGTREPSGTRITFQLGPRQSTWITYPGVFLDWVSVSGEVQCELRRRVPGDIFDDMLNRNTKVFILPLGKSCVIRGSN